MTIFIGIDNGVTGSIAIMTEMGMEYYSMPVKVEQSYTKAKQNITRVKVAELKSLISRPGLARCVIERPMINPGRWKATVSAIRCLESTLIVLEELGMPYEYIDSKEWQKSLLPSGLIKEELKKAAKDIAKRLYPHIELKKKQDADSILICHYAMLKYGASNL